MPHGAIPFPFGDCRICNDKATGVHYGVATCEGCKGFYKRSIPKGDKYRCYFGGKCVISPENRNRCKACRFRKCLEQGMAVDAVKMGRIPKVEKERALEQAAAERHGIMDQLSIPISASKEYIDLNSLCKEDQSRDKDEVLSYDGLSSVSSSDNIQMSGSLPEDLDVELDETVQTLENSIYTHFGLGLKIKQRELYYQKKLQWYSSQVMGGIHGFCKSVPGFMDLDPADQEVLLKRAYYDIWMLTASQFFLDGESYLFLHDGTFYTRCLMEQVIGKENTRTLHVFTQQFNALRLSQVEVAILCCIQLTAPGHDQPNLKNPQEIQTLNSYYLDLLVAVVTHNHPVTCSRVLVDIFRLIPLLADINRLQREIIANFSISSPVFEGQVDEGE
nr:hypothetical protein BaRGS_016317 [Batillaria attramentaria]